MIQTPPLTRTLISSPSVGDESCVALKCLFHHVTSRCAAGGRQDKWQMNTDFRYHPDLCCHYLFSCHLKTTFALASDPSQSRGSNAPAGNTVVATVTQQASYFFSPSLVLKVCTAGAKCHSHLLCLTSFWYWSVFRNPQFQNDVCYGRFQNVRDKAGVLLLFKIFSLTTNPTKR